MVAGILIWLTGGQAQSLPQQPTLVSHDFATSTDGWQVSGDSGSFEPYLHASGGDPGGYISHTDEALGETWYFRAPDSVLAALAAAEHGTLSYRIKQSAEQPSVVDDDIVIVGPAGRLSYRFRTSPGTSWTRFAVTLTAAPGWRWNWNAEASQEQMRRVLANPTSLEIRGEYHTGPDEGALDSVALTAVSLARGRRQDPQPGKPDRPCHRARGWLHVAGEPADFEVVAFRFHQTPSPSKRNGSRPRFVRDYIPITRANGSFGQRQDQGLGSSDEVEQQDWRRQEAREASRSDAGEAQAGGPTTIRAGRTAAGGTGRRAASRRARVNQEEFRDPTRRGRAHGGSCRCCGVGGRRADATSGSRHRPQLVTVRGESMNGIAEIENGLARIFQTRGRNVTLETLSVAVRSSGLTLHWRTSPID